MTQAGDRRWNEPEVIQGGMGIAISGWPLARAVAKCGQLGVVSGTALDVVHARRLADGDEGGHLRRAYETFPAPEMAEGVLKRYYRAEGRPPDKPYPTVPTFTLNPGRPLQEIAIVSSYAEVWLAREGHEGPVGINLLEKVQMPTIFTLYGAMLAGVDAVLMGAGIPSAVPSIIRSLAAGKPVHYSVHVDRVVEPTGVDVAAQAPAAPEPARIELDPAWFFDKPAELQRPEFLAIISSHTLGHFLARDPHTRPDGFVIEGYIAGGHNAPPRRGRELDGRGQPVYGPRDEADLKAVAKLGLPFWLAGGYGSPDKLVEAREAGASGIQVGSAFACCQESGLATDLRSRIIDAARAGTLSVRTDPLASPTGFPFKLVELDGTLSDMSVRESRDRVCDLGYLRVAYENEKGAIGYRCAGEPESAYLRKGGKPDDMTGRACLCNGLLATAGYAQVRGWGAEPPIVTGGDDLPAALANLVRSGEDFTASDVIDYLIGANTGS